MKNFTSPANFKSARTSVAKSIKTVSTFLSVFINKRQWKLVSIVAVILLSAGLRAQAQSTTIAYVAGGTYSVITVPAGVTKMGYTVAGGAGGAISTGAGGLGGIVTGIFSVTPGQTLYVFVGGVGQTYGAGAAGGPSLGGEGGGNGGSGDGGGGGGAASDIRTSITGGATSAASLASRIVTAGGGGGGCYCSSKKPGGAGGNPGITGTASCGSGGGGATILNVGIAGAGGTAGSGATGGTFTTTDDEEGGGGGGGWKGGGGSGEGGGGGGSSYAVSSAPQDYSLTATYTSTQSGSGSVTICFYPDASASISSANPGCVGNSINFTGTSLSGTSFQWTGPAGGAAIVNPTSLTTASVTAMNASNAGVYTLAVTNACGTVSVTTSALAVNASATAVSPTISSYTVCAGSSVTFSGGVTGGTGLVYAWTGPTTGMSSTVTLNPSISSVVAANAGAYSLTVSSAGCATLTGTTNANPLVVGQLPSAFTPTFTSTNPSCYGNTININPNITGGSSLIYAWTGPTTGMTSTAVSNPVIPSAVVANTGSYSLVVTAPGCAGSVLGNTNSAPLIVNRLPTTLTATVTPYPSASSATPCAPVYFLGNTAGATNATYAWTAQATGDVIINPTTLNSVISAGTASITSTGASDAGVYTLTATAPGCGSSQVLTNTLTVNNPPGLNALVTSNTFCYNGSATQTAAFSYTLAVNGAVNYTLNWPAGGPTSVTSLTSLPGTNTITATVPAAMPAGVYTGTLSVSNSGGCASTYYLTLTENRLPTTFTATVTPNPVCVGVAVTLTATATGGYGAAYSWNGQPAGSSIVNPNSLGASITSAATGDAGVYTVTASAAKCSTSNALTGSLVVNSFTVATGLTESNAGSNPILFSGGSAFQTSITSIVAQGAGSPHTLTGTGTDYTLSSTGITLVPNSDHYITAAGTYTITVNSAGCAANLIQTIGAGVATSMSVSGTAMTGPTYDGFLLANQPTIDFLDTWGNQTTNYVSGVPVVTVTPGNGGWTVGGTATVTAVGGYASFTNLTAFSPVTVTTATAVFASTGLTSYTSSPTFTITVGTVTATPATLTGFTSYTAATSQIQTFTVTALPGIGGNFTITPTANYQVWNGAAFVSTVIVTPTAGVYSVELVAGSTVAGAVTGTITVAAYGAATVASVTCSGTLYNSVTWYSQGTGEPLTLSNWNSVSAGGGITPTTFGHDGDTWIVKSAMTTAGGTWNIGTSGLTNASTLQFNTGGSITSSGTGLSLNLYGNFVATTGYYQQSGYTSPENATFNIYGNCDITGSFYMYNSPAYDFINMLGGTAGSPVTLRNTSTYSNWEFNTFFIASSAVVQLNGNFDLNTMSYGGAGEYGLQVNGTLIMPTPYTVSNTSSGETTYDALFNLNAGATVSTNNASGLAGAVNVISNSSYSTGSNFSAGANYIFYGATTAPWPTAYLSWGQPASITVNGVHVTSNAPPTTPLTPTGTLSITPTGQLDMSAYQLAAGTGFTIANSGLLTTASTANPAIPAGTWGGAVSYTAPAQYVASGTYSNVTTGTGAYTATGTTNINSLLTIPSAGRLNMTTYALGGTLTSGTGMAGTLNTGCISSTASPAIPAGLTWGGTVVYTATGTQAVATGTYNNLSCTGIGTYTIAGSGTAVNVNGALSVPSTGTLDMGTTQLGGTPSGVTMNGTLKTQCTGASPAIPNGYTWNGTVNYYATTGNTAIGYGTYSNLATNAGTYSVAGATSVNATYTGTAGGVLNMGTYSLTGTGFTSAGSGSILSGATNALPLPASKTWVQNITYNGASAQTIVPGNYNAGLTNANTTGNSGLAAGTVSVVGTFSVAPGSSLNDNGNLIGINNGTVAGTGTVTSTGSGAININTASSSISGAPYLGNVNVGASFTVTGTPTLTGILALGVYTVNTNGSTGSIAINNGSYTGTGFVYGTLYQNLNGYSGGTITYPVGDVNYAPVTLTLNGYSSPTGYIGVQSAPGISPYSSLGACNISSTADVLHNWTISSIGATGFNSVTPTFSYNTADIAGGSNSLFAVQAYSLATASWGSLLTANNTSGPVYSTTPTSPIAASAYQGNYYIGNYTQAALALYPATSPIPTEDNVGSYPITYTDDAFGTWTNNIYSVTASIGVSTYSLAPGADYINLLSGTAGTIALQPNAGGDGKLEVAGNYTVTVYLNAASGYPPSSVVQTVQPGVATQMYQVTGPVGPVNDGYSLATQPAIGFKDQYGNKTITYTSGTPTVTASVSSGGTWTIGGTTTAAAVSGTVTLTGITAYNATSITTASITLTSTGTGESIAPLTTTSFAITVGTVTATPATLTGWSTYTATTSPVIQTFTVGGTRIGGSYSITPTTNFYVWNSSASAYVNTGFTGSAGVYSVEFVAPTAAGVTTQTITVTGYVAGNTASVTCTGTATVPLGLPFFEDFPNGDGTYALGATPTNITGPGQSGSPVAEYNGAYGTTHVFVTAPPNGHSYVMDGPSYGGSTYAWIETKAIAMTANTQYTFKVLAQQSYYDYQETYNWAVSAFFTTSTVVPTSAVTSIGTAISGASATLSGDNWNTISGTFTPTLTGVYYVAVLANATFSYCEYMAFSDLAVCQVPTVTATPSANPVCAGSTLSLTATAAPAFSNYTFAWNGTANGTIANTGTQIASITGIGSATLQPTFSVTVTSDIANTCFSSAQLTETVSPNPVSNFSYASSPYCSTASTASVTFTGGGTAGVFSISPSTGLTINTSTGLATISGSTPGTYVVTNTVGGGGACSSVFSTANLVVNQYNNPGFTYASSAYCTSTNTISPSYTSSLAPTFSFTATPSGLSIAGLTGVITPSLSTAQTYTITNTSVVGGCTNAVSTATVTLNQQVAVTTEPANASAISGNAASFSVAATGTGLGYQWYEDNGSGGLAILSYPGPNATGAGYAGYGSYSLAIGNTQTSMDGYLYYCKISGTSPCASLNTTPEALLNVGAIAFTLQPTAVTDCYSSIITNSAVFTAGTNPAPTTVQWYENQGSGFVALSDGTTGGINYSGSGTLSLTVTGLTTSQNGWHYECKANGTVFSASALLTVNTPISIGGQPVGNSSCTNGATSFSVSAVTGTSPSYQWQVSNNLVAGSYTSIPSSSGAYSVYSGYTTGTLTVSNPAAGMNGYYYQCIVSGASACSSVGSSSVVLTTQSPASITTNPVALLTVCNNSSGSFSVVATSGVTGYLWYLSTGGSYSPLSDGGVYSGTHTGTLTITNPAIGLSGYKYECIVSGTSPCLTTTSSVGTLSVTTSPISVSVGTPTTICASGTTNITATPSGGSAYTYAWSGPGTISGGATATAAVTPTTSTTASGSYIYQVSVTSAGTSCIAVGTGTVVAAAQPTFSFGITTPTVCVSSAITLTTTITAGAGTLKYNWSGPGITTVTNSGSAPTTFTPSVSGAPSIFTVTAIYSGSGCAAITYTAAATVDGILTVTPTNNGAVCINGTATLTGTATGGGGAGSYAYTWTGDAGSGAVSPLSGATANPIPTSSATHVYTLTVSTTGGCGNVYNTTSIAVAALPTVQVTNISPLEVCAGNTATVTVGAVGGGAGTVSAYNWAGSDGSFQSVGTTTVVFTPTMSPTSVYSVTVVMTGSGCSGGASHTGSISVDPLPTLTYTASPSSICLGSTISVAATWTSSGGAHTWSWRGPGIPSVTGSPTLTASFIPSVTPGGVYTVSSDWTGCTSAVFTQTVAVNGSLTVTPVNDGAICVGGTSNLSSSVSGGSGSYTYAWTGDTYAGLPIPANTSSLSATPTGGSPGSEVYTLTVSSPGGCPAATVTTTVPIHSIPVTTITATSPSALCAGSVATLTPSYSNLTGSFVEYVWTSSDGSLSTISSSYVTTTPTATATSYSVTVISSGSACIGSVATTTVTVAPQPSLTFAATPSSVCINGIITVTTTATGGTGIQTYSWSGPGVGGSSSSAPTSLSPTVTAAAGVYSLSSAWSGYGCVTATQTQTVTVYGNVSVTATNNGPLCAAGIASLSATSVSGGSGSYTYAWTGDASAGLLSTTGSSVTASPTGALATEVYTLSVSSPGGCAPGTAITTATVNAVPTINSITPSPAALCSGSVTLTAGSVSGGAGSLTDYIWSSNQGYANTTPSATVTDVPTITTTYSVTVNYSGSGCTGVFATIQVVTVTAAPSIGSLTVSLTPTANVLCTSGVINLTANGVTGGTGATTYTWNGPGMSTATSSSPTLTYTTSGTAQGAYSVTLASAGLGCPNSNTATSASYTVVPQPSVTLTVSAATVCTYATETLTAIPSNGTGTASYTWTGPGISGSAGPYSSPIYTVSSSTVAPTAAYTVILSYGGAGCLPTNGSSSSVTFTNQQQWTGSSDGNWNNYQNWACGVVPSATQNVVIPTSYLHVPTVNVTSFVSDLTISSGAVLTLGSYSLCVAGTFSNSATVNGSGVIYLNGSSTQSLKGNGKVRNLTLGNNATIGTSGDTVGITGTLLLGSSTLTTNGALMLVSDASDSGVLGMVSGTGAISGNTVVQQYIRGGRRAYRFIAHPFSTPVALSQIEPYIDITGYGGSTNGFTNTTTNSPSAYSYSTTAGNSSLGNDPGWIAYSNITQTIAKYEGIRLFVRGSKGEGLYATVPYSYTIDPLTYRTYGAINYGPQTVTMDKGTNSDFNLLGNPYPAVTDIGAVLNSAVGVTGAAFYVWDPYMGTSGAFLTKNYTDFPHYYIGPNESFEVEATINGATISYTESNKGTTVTDALMRNAASKYLELEVYDTTYHPWDILDVSFNDAATDSRDTKYDALKPPSPASLNFYSLSADNDKLSFDSRPFGEGKIIPLGLTTSYAQDFIIRAESAAVPAGGQVYLHDKYLQTYTLLQQGTEYRFGITKDAASQGDQRFELSMKPGGVAATTKGIDVQMMPNPATSEVTISYTTTGKEATSVRVMNVAGVTVQTMDLGVNQHGSATIDLSKMAAGVYMVEITSGTDKVVHRLVKE